MYRTFVQEKFKSPWLTWRDGRIQHKDRHRSCPEIDKKNILYSKWQDSHGNHRREEGEEHNTFSSPSLAASTVD